MATGKVVISNGNRSVEKVYVRTLKDGSAFEYDGVIFIKNHVIGADRYYGFSICGEYTISTDQLVTPVDLEIKVIR